MKWRFVCPVCEHVACTEDWMVAGAPSGAVGFACVGRWVDGSRDAFYGEPGSKGPCNYTGGGLFGLNPVLVKEFPAQRDVDGARVFAFADPLPQAAQEEPTR